MIRGGGGGGVISTATAVAAALRALVAAVHAEIRAKSGPRVPRHPGEGDDESLYSRARIIIESEAARRDLTVDALARRLGVGRRRLERAFQRRGESPGDVLRAHRLRLARGLLSTERDRSLTEIADLSGFPSARALKDALAKHRETDPHQSGAVRSQRRRE